AVALALIVRGIPGGFRLQGNRLRNHVLGWTLLAATILVLDFLGPQVEPVLNSVLGRSAEILVEFCGRHGLFLAAAALLVAGALGAIGSAGQLTRRPGAIERTWAR